MKTPIPSFLGLLLLAVSFPAFTAGAATVPGDVTVTLSVDRQLLPADSATTAVIKVEVEAPPLASPTQRTPVNVSIVLDRSGSMSGAKIEHARQAAIDALRRLGPNDVFSLVTYDSSVETLIPAQVVRDPERIEALIRGITPRGMTALYGGVNQGTAELRKHLDGRFVHRIILLSDGIANVGPSTPADLERLGRALARENIAVTTIGIGLDYNEDLMTRLARASDGNTYFVEASQDLPRILGAELGDVLNVAARRVIIRLRLAEGIRPVSILGREGEIRDNVVEIPLHQLYGGQGRYALVEVHVPARPKGDRLSLAEAEVVYEDVTTQRERRVQSPWVETGFSSDEAELKKTANLEVLEQALAIRTAEARERAIELADQGKRDEAAAELQRVGQFYRETARHVSAPAAFDDRADAISLEAESVGQRGIDNRQRKEYRSSNLQEVNQQNTR